MMHEVRKRGRKGREAEAEDWIWMKEKPLIVRPLPANTAKTGSTTTTFGKNEHNDDNIIVQ